MNREIEVNYSHRMYFMEYNPRRNRLTHSLIFEEFEVALERWIDLEEQFRDKGYNLIEIN